MNDEKKINTLRPLQGAGRKLFVETYGCQMNVGDTEIVVAIMQQEGYVYTDKIEEADVVLINTCSIRDNAEQRIWGRLREMAHLRRRRPGVLVGIIGCMAERLRERLLEGENPVDIVAGPDAYRDLPRLVREAGEGGRGVNVLLSREETYAEIAPVRLDRNGVSAFVSIMRGCNNMCSYCVVPYTRGVERSRDPQTILNEARSLFENGYREVTLLGQNVNSYRYGAVDFPELMRLVAEISPLLRVRFVGIVADAREDEPQIYTRMVPRPHRRYPPLYARLRDYDRPDRRILQRNGRGSSADAFADAGGGV